MTNKTLVIFVATIMVVGMFGTNFVPSVDALKSKGTGTSQYGSSTNICGLIMCSDYPGGKEAYLINWSTNYLDSSNVSTDDHSNLYDSNDIELSVIDVDEFTTQLDEVIHKFELDKISAEEALDGIIKIHTAYVNEKITNNIIDSVGEKLTLIDSGKLSGADAVEAIHLSAEPQNVNPEYQGALDEVIHKFELDKISAEEALDGIKEAHYGFVNLYITSDLIDAVEAKITLIDSGKLSGADAVEAIHLSAEPQNVNPELIGAIDEYLHKFELDKISAEETMNGVVDAHAGFVDLYVTSDLVDSIGIQLDIYKSGDDSASHILEEIHEMIEEEEAAMAELIAVSDEVTMKELPPNTVDMPIGAGVPGCETSDVCYTPSHLTIHTGTTVTWINSDGSIPHTVTAGWPDTETTGLDYPGGNGFDSDFMSGGATFEHTFEIPGEYDYYCQLHPWMIGSVLVE